MLNHTFMQRLGIAVLIIIWNLSKSYFTLSIPSVRFTGKTGSPGLHPAKIRRKIPHRENKNVRQISIRPRNTLPPNISEFKNFTFCKNKFWNEPTCDFFKRAFAKNSSFSTQSKISLQSGRILICPTFLFSLWGIFLRILAGCSGTSQLM